MNQSIEFCPEMTLMGMTARTSNAAEMNAETAQIGTVMQAFFTSGVRDKIVNRKNPHKVFAVYTDYESDEHGAYTYFLGEEVTRFDMEMSGLQTLVIPGQRYMKWTSEPGQMPGVVIDMWQRVWAMTAADLGGQRAYLADFEVYDERSKDLHRAVVDLYIGIK